MTIKFLTPLCCVLLIASRSFAQEAPERLEFQAKEEKYRKMKNAGAILTIGGGGVAVTGILIGVVGVFKEAFEVGAGEKYLAPAVNAIYIGGGICLVGTPFFIVGKKSERKYKNKYLNYHAQSSHTRLNLYPRRNGLTLIYRF